LDRGAREVNEDERNAHPQEPKPSYKKNKPLLAGGNAFPPPPVKHSSAWRQRQKQRSWLHLSPVIRSLEGVEKIPCFRSMPRLIQNDHASPPTHSEPSNTCHVILTTHKTAWTFRVKKRKRKGKVTG
jgi:hypothetical protein